MASGFSPASSADLFRDTIKFMKEALPTQNFVDVQEIKDGVVYLKSGGMRKIMMVGGINFDLKSAQEQEVILGSFQQFLNGIDFSIQFFIHSRKVNVEKYLEAIKTRKASEENELIKIQIDDYVDFVKSFVQDNPVISKNFFAVIPYDVISLKKSAKGFLSLFRKSRIEEEQEAAMERLSAEQHLQQLNERVAEVVAGLSSVGLRVQSLDDDSLTELFYNLYNPRLMEKKGLEILKKS